MEQIPAVFFGPCVNIAPPTFLTAFRRTAVREIGATGDNESLADVPRIDSGQPNVGR